MLILAIILYILPAWQEKTIPFLEEDKYSYEIEFFLKKKPPAPNQIYDINEKQSPRADVLPYVKIEFTFRSFEKTDKKIQVFRAGRILNSKKIKGPMNITLDMGYAVDMKEGVEPSEYVIYIVNDDNERRARINISVKENGELYINDTMSGMI